MSSLIDSNSRFSGNPTRLLNVPRAQFDLSNTIKLSFNIGDLIPFDVQEVLPGDTFDIETNVLARLQTLITPPMDDLYLDMYYFFVPNRLCWKHWKNFMGENTESAWTPETVYSVPQIAINGSPSVGSVLDYMGFPVDTNKTFVTSVNALPMRAYALIYNEWFRDQNLVDPALIDLGDSTANYNDSDPAKGGKPFKVSKYHDYFTSALPTPQKGPDVTIPMLADDNFPVFADSEQIPSELTGNAMSFWAHKDNGTPVDNSGIFMNGTGHLSWTQQSPTITSPTGYLAPNNLWANISDLPVATINQLRLAFATQRLYEKDARGGTRYIEILRSHFGVISPDARQQRPELLSYNHIPVQVQQIVQNSETNTTPQGTTAGMSVTANSDGSFIKSFTEHGYIIGLCCARYNHTYQQGLNRLWSRINRFDFYWPVFANIGEQPVLNKEIFLSPSTDGVDNPVNNEVFGYQEAWADYRYKPNRTAGEMRSSAPQSLDVWHFGDDYENLPTLSASWIAEEKANVDRTLAVQSTVSNQMFMDVYIKNKATRPMPMYSIPGMSDKL